MATLTPDLAEQTIMIPILPSTYRKSTVWCEYYHHQQQLLVCVGDVTKLGKPVTSAEQLDIVDQTRVRYYRLK